MVKKKRRLQDEHFQVEVVTAVRVHEGGFHWEYHVKWAGWDSDADSWEPDDNLIACEELLTKFWDHVGDRADEGCDEDGNYPPGYQVDASSEWIKQERVYFRKKYPKELELAIRQRERMDRKTKQKRDQEEQRKVQKMEKEISKQSKPMTAKSTQVKQYPAESRPSFRGTARMQTIIVSDSSAGDSDGESTVAVRVPTKRKAPELPPIIVPPLKQLSAQDVLPPLRKVSGDEEMTSRIQTTHLNILDKGKQKESNVLAEQRTRESSVESTGSLFSAKSLPATTSPATNATNRMPKTGTTSKTFSYVKRKKEPRIKIFEPENLKGGSTLSTKQMIAQKMLAVSTVSPPKQRTSDLQSKTNTSAPSPSTSKGSQAVRPLPPEPTLVPDDPIREIRIQPTASNTVDAQALVHPSEEYVQLADYDPDPFESFVSLPEPDISPIMHAPALPAVPTQDTFAKVDTFLNDMMAVDSAVSADDPVTELASLPKITKKWKWKGSLVVEHEADKPEHLCEIVITDATDHFTEGLRLNILLSETRTLQFLKPRRVSELDLILRACKPSEQVARLEPHGEEDGVVIKALANSMILNKRVAFTRMFQNGYEVAMLLTFPTLMSQLCDTFKVPDSLRNSVLVSAVVPLSIMPQLKESEWRCYKDNGMKPTHHFPLVRTKERRLEFDSLFSRAVRTLEIPESLHNFLSQSSRVYCIWDDSTTMTRTETEWLMSILNRSGAKKAGTKAESRLVFIHVGATRTLFNLPHLAEKRSRQPNVQFYVYGTHEAIPPKRWDVHEIFPLGGVVTFTPQAMVDNPVGVYELIKQIAMHRCWTAFILPAVMGMASKLIYGGEDPLAAFDRGEFVFDLLLKQIEDGMVSFTSSPPISRNPSRDCDPVFDWIERQLKVSFMQTRGYLEESMRSWKELYSNSPEPEWPTGMEAHIKGEMNRMQMQPEIMDNYRRFVVIKAASEIRLSEYCGGFEFLTLSTFDFKDQYFTSEERDRAR